MSSWSVLGWTVDTSSPLFPESVPGIDADPMSFFSGAGGQSRKELICPLPWVYKHQKVFCFTELDLLTPLPGSASRPPFRGSACCPPHNVDLATLLVTDGVRKDIWSANITPVHKRYPSFHNERVYDVRRPQEFS